MAAFATAADLATRLGVTFTADETTRADNLLARASGLVRDVAGQTVDLVTNDVLTIRGTNEERILLPQRPVVSVASVELDGVELDGWYVDGNALVRDGLFAHVANGAPSCWARGFGWPSQELAITYTHGYAADAIPGIVSGVVLEAVVRVWVNPGAVMIEGRGSEQVTYVLQGMPSGLLLTADEKKELRRFFGRRGGGVWQS